MLVSNKTKDKRLYICNGCEFKRSDFKLFGITIFKRVPQCRICKCAIEKKVKFSFAKCPKDKWQDTKV